MKTILQEELNRLRQLMLSEEMVQSDGYKKLKQTIDILKKKDKVLLLSCSNRYQFDSKNIDIPKSKLLALHIQEELGDKATFIDITELKILPCEGNVSRKDGNTCGLLKASLKDKKKNPS